MTIDSILSLKVELLLYLRRYYNSNTIICPKHLIEKYNKTKGAISQTLKLLIDSGLIKFQLLTPGQKKGCRKAIKLTKEGYLTTTEIILEGLKPTEQKAIKALDN